MSDEDRNIETRKQLAKQFVTELQSLVCGEIPPALDGMPDDMCSVYSVIALRAGMILSLMREEPLSFVMGELAGMALETEMQSVMEDIFKNAENN